jgi:hypothetical protein
VDIKIKVTKESWYEHSSIEAWLNFTELTNKEMYDLMLKFVVDDKGQPMDEKKARKLFLKIPPKKWEEYVQAFVKQITEAFVNPTKGSS